jgi:Flp pilus assembly protein TadG
MGKLLKNTKGAAMVIAAVFIPVMIGLAALMVDVGIAFSTKGRIEYIAVQAVDAAEAKLPNGPLAETYAENLAMGLIDTSMRYAQNPVVTATSDGVEISIQIAVDTMTFFAPIWGVTGLTVRAGATRPLN